MLEAPDSSEAESPASNNSTMGSDVENDPTLKLFLKDQRNEINRNQQFMGCFEQTEKRIKDSIKEFFRENFLIHLITEEQLYRVYLKSSSI
jgi:hypothetical protein